METTKIEGLVERFSPTIELDSLIGKPITVTLNGKKRQIGTITKATAKHDHIQIEGGITDTELQRSLTKHSLKKFRVNADG